MATIGTITSVNAIINLMIPGVFDAPQRLQGFSADDIFDTPAIQAAEISQGLDGLLSGGFIYKEVSQDYSLQANSPSNLVFDNWYNAQLAQQDLFYANGNASLKGIRTQYQMVRGILLNYTPVPGAGKTLKARKHTVVWQSITPQPL